MALSLASQIGNIKVVSSKDSAVTCNDEEYQSYLEDLDESKLKLEGEPTRFVMKRVLSYKEQEAVKNSQVKVEKGNVSITMGFMMQEVRQALVDIENPADADPATKIEYKRESDGKTSYDLIALLESAGICSELYAARAANVKVVTEVLKKK